MRQTETAWTNKNGNSPLRWWLRLHLSCFSSFPFLNVFSQEKGSKPPLMGVIVPDTHEHTPNTVGASPHTLAQEHNRFIQCGEKPD